LGNTCRALWGALCSSLGDKGAYYYGSFGAPIAHGDDTARAVQAALELRTPPAECRYVRGLQLGLSQGPVYAGAYGGQDHQAYDTLGDSVNLAARLMQAAAPGGILATPEIFHATEGRFQWAGLPALAVKGKRAPVPVYGLVEQIAGSGRALFEPAYRTPLIGRTAELAAIAERLAQAASGSGQIVALTAEAGVGKSRVIAEVVRRARAAGFKVYGGAAQSYGAHTPYLAWQPIWQAFFDLEPGAPADDLAMQLEDALTALVPDRLSRLPVLGPALGLTLPDTTLTAGFDAQLRNESLVALLIDCVRARAVHTPLVFVLEDCQWLDALAHDLLEAIGRASATLPVLLVLAYRPPEIERLQAPRVTALPHCLELQLAPFGFEESQALVHARLGPDLPAETLNALIQRAEGNPFYLEEFVNYLLERGVDVRDAAAVAQLDWPESLQRLLLARIDQLTEQQRTVLKVASIVGRRFQFRQLWGVYPPLGAIDAVYADLMELDELDLTRLDAPGETGQDEPALAYLFKHIVTQEVAYTSLPRALRAQLHEQFAAWLEAGSAAADMPAPPDLLAYHYGQSANTAKQREYLRKAGEAAARLCQRRGAGMLRAALALTAKTTAADVTRCYRGANRSTITVRSLGRGCAGAATTRRAAGWGRRRAGPPGRSGRPARSLRGDGGRLRAGHRSQPRGDRIGPCGRRGGIPGAWIPDVGQCVVASG
jgi:hypothetical protein